MKHIISLGAGVQSSTMALMAAHGEITPMPDCAIFADTKAEPQAVYTWLDWLEQQLPFPVYRVSAGNLREAIGASRPTGKFAKLPIPAFIQLLESDNEKARKGGLLRRQCTTDYKIHPLTMEIRRVLGIYRKRTPPGILCTRWVGISTDEASRMKDAREEWSINRWPLIELEMTRSDCKTWMKDNGYPEPPRSACTFCPFHSNAEWRDLKDNDPEAFKDAINIDRQIRTLWKEQDRKAEFYLHKSCTPLESADLGSSNDKINLFENECEGMCGI